MLHPARTGVTLCGVRLAFLGWSLLRRVTAAQRHAASPGRDIKSLWVLTAGTCGILCRRDAGGP